MVRHVILWQLKDSFTEEEKLAVMKGIKEGLEGLVGQVPGLLSAHVQYEKLAGCTADVMLDSEFESEEALRAYKDHPAHVAVADGKVRPNVKVRVSIDYMK